MVSGRMPKDSRREMQTKVQTLSKSPAMPCVVKSWSERRIENAKDSKMVVRDRILRLWETLEPNLDDVQADAQWVKALVQWNRLPNSSSKGQSCFFFNNRHFRPAVYAVKMKVLTTFHQPSSVVASVVGHLTADRAVHYLVVAYMDRLVVHSAQPDGLRHECTSELWGRIISLKLVPTKVRGLYLTQPRTSSDVVFTESVARIVYLC